jgi:phosphoribosylaminoimidazole carboxylase PurE protein
MYSVGILLGSPSDLSYLPSSLELLRRARVGYWVEVASAHRTPDKVREVIQKMEEGGVEVFIAIAGFSAALPGFVAAHTLKPVLGVPLNTSPLQGVDSLLSIVQMPPGIPVATLGVGESGVRNGVVLALQILALKKGEIARFLTEYRSQMREEIQKKVEEGAKNLPSLRFSPE